MDYAGEGFFFTAAYARLLMGGVDEAGANGVIQGYISPKNKAAAGAITFEAGAFFMTARNSALLPVEHLIPGIVAPHELGHTLQFIALSALPIDPWIPYFALGGSACSDR